MRISPHFRFQAWTRSAALLMALGLSTAPVWGQSQTPQNHDASKPPSSVPPEAKPAPRPHRVITNDDLQPSMPAGSTPEIEERLRQLNNCDQACFQEAFKESSTALHMNWPYPFTMQETHMIEDALVQRVDRLRTDKEWQKRLRQSISLRLAQCQDMAKADAIRSEQGATGKSLTPEDIQAEENLQKQTGPRSGINYQADQELLDYRWKFDKDPLMFALMLHQYFAMIHYC